MAKLSKLIQDLKRVLDNDGDLMVAVDHEDHSNYDIELSVEQTSIVRKELIIK